MNKKFQDFVKSYSKNKIAVAVSGGLDSVCLLYWLSDMNLDLTVLHVNHKLRDVSDKEQDYVQSVADNLGLTFKSFDWTDEKPDTGLESAARHARYKMMTSYCKENKIDVLMTAHHADDQIDTFLMNLARGSGVYGLAAMRDVIVRDGIQLVRPLLNTYRKELKEYCDKNNIKYFNDEMNEDEDYMRVKIRKNRHVLRDTLDISDDRVLLAINNLARTREVLEIHIQELVTKAVKNNRAVFNYSFLFDEPEDIRLKLLGSLVQKIGDCDYQPRLTSLIGALDRLKHDCNFTLGHCSIRRLGDNILVVTEGESISFGIK